MRNWKDALDYERAVLNVDFDKTLTTGEGEPFWEDDENEFPNEKMVEWVNDQYHDGHVIIIWTARPWAQAGNVASYLTKWGVEWNGIRCDKGGGDLYIDDKAVNVEQVTADEPPEEVRIKEVVNEALREANRNLRVAAGGGDEI